MKKALIVIILILLFPITVFAKTQTLDETLSVIRKINNITVIDGVTIESTRIEDSKVVFVLHGQDEYVPYSFNNNDFSFEGGTVLLDGNNHVIGEIYDNAFAFFLYSILENKSSMPYDSNNYYSSANLKTLIDSGFATEYKEPTNTFGITLEKEEDNKYKVIYHYYLDGDYPVFDLEGGEGFENPATGNYNVLITIMLISVLCIGVYSYVNREKKKG